jgi:hypothetical protein
VEGFLPYFWIGFALGVAGAVLWGGLGAVICLLFAILVGRLATRGRAPGYPMTTVLAVTDTHVYALRTARSGDRQLGQWPRATVATRIRLKQVTRAITLDRPDGTPVRLELLYYMARKRPQAFLDSINRPQQVLAGEPAQREGQEAQLPGPDQTGIGTDRPSADSGLRDFSAGQFTAMPVEATGWAGQIPPDGNRNRRKGQGLAAGVFIAAAVVAVVAAIAVSFVIGGLHHGARAGPPAATSHSTTPPASVSQSAPSPASASQSADGWFVTVEDLRRGDCLTGSNLGLGKGGDWPETVQAVPCAQPHLAEVFYASNYWAAKQAYPGDKALNDQAGSRCERAFSSYVGIPWSKSEFDFDLVAPYADAWSSGDRLLVCIAFRPTHQAPGGTRLHGTIKGSRK